jgi:hypothetical protein
MSPFFALNSMIIGSFWVLDTLGVVLDSRAVVAVVVALHTSWLRSVSMLLLPYKYIRL